ncbi:hypothetical protein BDD12DRAFT_751928 [Trichophaea hybrida]|nr:hypothetical protein BDD12DRAFT_751928 [Trichophaea hybrida]
MWPLPARDAKLLRHYITHLGKWFDMHDNLGHFQTVVPLNSATCPMLMNASSLSILQLSHTSDDYDALVASHYHQSCLELYIPALSSVGPNNLDPSLLAATVLLRAFRELDGPYTEEEEPYLPSKLFSTLHLNPSISSDLRQACFWTYLRQDINTSFVSRQPIKINLNNLHLDRTFSSVDDATWANRITLHCASILQFAFGAQSPPSQASAAWTRLSNEVETWRKSRPHGFEPIFHSPCDPEKGKYFPETSFARDCHATGTQYYHLCRILLALYNPGFPGIAKGPRGVQEASRKVAEDVRVEVRAICGIAKSNRTVVPAWLLACRAVAVGAVWFEEEKERREMLGLLVETEREVGFPMEKVRRECERLWGMEGEGKGEELVKRE